MNGSSGTAWTQIFWRNVKCFKIKIPNLNQIRLFSKKLIMSILSIYECLTSCKKSEKTNERFFRYCMNADFWRNVKCFKIKIPNLNQIRIFSKKLIMSILSIYECLTSCKKSEKTKWTSSSGTAWTQIFWRNVKCFKIKIPNLNQIRLFSKKLIMSILSIYECLTSCKKSEKTNERFFRYCMNADFLT